MDTDQQRAQPDGAQAQNIMSALSNEMVRIYKAQFGRGPTRTRSQWAGPDIIIVTLEDTLTPAEHSLRRLGADKHVRDLRQLFQYAERATFCEPVERLTGRKVRAFISGIDTEIDLATETFILHPPGYDGESRSAT